MKTLSLNIDDIYIPPRQRAEIKEEALRELKRSIAMHGLFHAIVVRDTTEEEKSGDGFGKLYALVAGGRRLQAVRSLAKESINIAYSDNAIPLNEVPAVPISGVDEQEAAEIELEENLMRVDLTWQEKTAALARIHELKKMRNPNQTAEQTAIEIVESSPEKYSSPNAADSLKNNLVRAQVLAKHQNEPEVRNAKSEKEAFRIISAKTKTALAAELARRESPKTTHKLYIGKFIDHVRSLPGRAFDLILADPPYGMGAHKWAKGSDSTLWRSKAIHEYDDTPEYALEVSKEIIREGWELGKDKSTLFMFTSWQLFGELQSFAKKQGWDTWPRPIIWWKGPSGIAPWGSRGFRYTYEVIMFATKGGSNHGLISTLPDVIHVNQIDSPEHGASKPVELYTKLINAACYSGAYILDPCCGAGTIFQAANRTQTIAVGVELSEKYKNICELKMRKDYAHAQLTEPGDDD